MELARVLAFETEGALLAGDNAAYSRADGSGQQGLRLTKSAAAR